MNKFNNFFSPFFFIIILLGSVNSYSQSTDQQLAAQYFSQEEYDKASLYYERLYNKQPSDFNYQYYLKCLIKIRDFKKAVKIIKAQSKSNPRNVAYKIDNGVLYQQMGEPDKADKVFNNLIENLKPNHGEIQSTAKAFSKIGEHQYALETYLRGRKILKGAYPYNFEIAQVYGDLKNYEAMIDEYLNLLLINESYLQSVQNVLNRYFGFDKSAKQNKILKDRLLRQIQKNPNKKIFSEMLIWLYVQEKDFEGAMIQSKALDNRFNLFGAKVMELSSLCISNSNYDLAVSGYDYVVNIGDNSPYYETARIGKLNALKKKITTQISPSAQDLIELQISYSEAIQDIDGVEELADLYLGIAEIEAYYLKNVDTAITYLEKAIGLSRLSETKKAKCKINLADLLLIQGFIWDASLMYGQVEKDFKYDVIGEEAKFKNAKISFYTGEFKWAKAQLDVLKGATSKLIANDALALSLLITDNSTIDTTTESLKMYARADLMLAQYQFNRAIEILDSLMEEYPGHSLQDEIYLEKYYIYFKQAKYEQAKENLEQIIGFHSYDITADNALFYLAEMYEKIYNDKEKAKENYLKLLTDYPGSMFVIEARKRYRALRGDSIN